MTAEELIKKCKITYSVKFFDADDTMGNSIPERVLVRMQPIIDMSLLSQEERTVLLTAIEQGEVKVFDYEL